MIPILYRISSLTMALLFVACSANAHTPRETYVSLFVSESAVTGHWDVAVQDLQIGLKLDPATLEALPASDQEQRIEALAIDTITRLDIKVNQQPLVFRVTDLETVTLNVADYARVHFVAGLTGTAPSEIKVDLRSLFSVDTNLFGILRVNHPGGSEMASFSFGSRERSFVLNSSSTRAGGRSMFTRLYLMAAILVMTMLLAGRAVRKLKPRPDQ